MIKTEGKSKPDGCQVIGMGQGIPKQDITMADLIEINRRPGGVVLKLNRQGAVVKYACEGVSVLQRTVINNGLDKKPMFRRMEVTLLNWDAP